MQITPGFTVREEERLAKLHGYTAIEEYEKSGAFQHIAGMAARMFDVPVAFVNIVDRDSVLIKGSIGLTNVKEISRSIGLCSLAIQRDEVTVFENTRTELSLSANPLIYGEPGFQFYAGAPLKTSDGYSIGAVGVADYKPRNFAEAEELMLEALATTVMEELSEMQLMSVTQ
ncbi:hypothetical protein PKOR_05005 [Pontibacter korlensis]|uniref:GAF domain-containing protein n=1 Tax=Pontibacter korlensis TaxID=400092 RepID=A0A0E3ZJC3_9BACT|nr:hypothetical protein PKOR_05005 [Pontibacter korlensis]